MRRGPAGRGKMCKENCARDKCGGNKRARDKCGGNKRARDKCGGNNLEGIMWREQFGRNNVEGTMWREQCGGNNVEGTVWREQCGGINMEGTMWREPCGCGGSKRTWTKTQYSQIHRSVNSATGNNCTDTAIMCDWFSDDHSNCRYYSLESSHVTVNTQTTHPQHAGISQPT